MAALKQWAYEISFPNVLDEDGYPYMFRIPPRPACDWIIASIEPGHLGYLPGLLPDDQHGMLIDALADGLLTAKELLAANREALELMSGWRWWEAGRLIATMVHDFETAGGLLVLSGLDLGKAPLGAVLAAIYARAWSESDKEGRAALASAVTELPADMVDPTRDGEWDEDAAEQAVRMLMKHGATGLPD
jgi:hypothetical protein